MDPLTELFSSMRVRRAGFTRMNAYAPWGVESAGDPAIKFVLVVRGSAVLTTKSNPTPIPLGAGDVFIILGDEPYQVCDHESSTMAACVDVDAQRIGNQIEFGGGGAVTTFVSGFFEIDRLDAKPLLCVLPVLLHLKMEQERTLAFQSVLELLATETEGPRLGSDAAAARLFELLFIHAVRAFTQECSIPKKGWLAAAADKNLAPAIRAIHAEPKKAWTVDLLAREAGMSRSAFAARFKSVVGQTPLGYLTEWRMHKASRLMEANSVRIAEIARSVGYESEAAFTKAFKKSVGTNPSIFRKTVFGHKPTLAKDPLWPG
ncbi:AraC family transcriptional regulator [Rhizobiaceae bacterium n13]|uniref:AraC family transcriptional regulator n=1 Tax=Ferirhizobium litorale TaxID=2927786 RepID=A0AAE3QKJ6_9HYPH|nr:AraC family transcriptional regulator [Fererhizobium litorale]MDI7865029.1 AraC family transcriptional regulator [Fererhizobium litorale]MDI7925205.1 AraC family transcriptional regulator [Fererhizobium litorale]